MEEAFLNRKFLKSEPEFRGVVKWKLGLIEVSSNQLSELAQNQVELQTGNPFYGVVKQALYVNEKGKLVLLRGGPGRRRRRRRKRLFWQLKGQQVGFATRSSVM